MSAANVASQYQSLHIQSAVTVTSPLSDVQSPLTPSLFAAPTGPHARTSTAGSTHHGNHIGVTGQQYANTQPFVQYHESKMPHQTTTVYHQQQYHLPQQQ